MHGCIAEWLQVIFFAQLVILLDSMLLTISRTTFGASTILLFKSWRWRWPKGTSCTMVAAIRNFLDNSRKFNFCSRLILKLLHFFSIKKILKMYYIVLFFKHHLFEFILLLNVLEIIFKMIIFKGLFVFILEALHFYFGFILSFVCSCFGFFLFH